MNYQVNLGNSSIPLASQMSDEDKAKGELLVISHMGWARQSLTPNSSKIVRAHVNNMKKDLLKNRVYHSLSPEDKELHDNQLIKTAFFVLQTRFLLEELVVENAFENANRKGMPIVLTIPCLENDFRKPVFNVNEGGGAGTFAPYLAYKTKGKKNVYALSTRGKFGLLSGDKTSRWDDIKRFEKSEKGKQLIGDLTSIPWKNVYFAGGGINSCLMQTLTYFVGVDSIKILDDCVFPNSRPSIDLSKTDMKKAIKRIPLLYKTKTEPEGRSELAKILSKYEPVKNRTDEYVNVLWLFDKYGLKKGLLDKVRDPKAQLQLIRLN